MLQEVFQEKLRCFSCSMLDWHGLATSSIARKVMGAFPSQNTRREVEAGRSNEMSCHLSPNRGNELWIPQLLPPSCLRRLGQSRWCPCPQPSAAGIELRAVPGGGAWSRSQEHSNFHTNKHCTVIALTASLSLPSLQFKTTTDSN